MLFKLSYTVQHLDILSEEILNFRLEGAENIHLSVRAPNKEERSKDHKSFNAFLDILGEFEPTKKSHMVFIALADGKRPPEGEKAMSAEDMIHRDGPSYGLDYYPNPFVSFVDEIHSKLNSVGDALVSILRWRYAQEGPRSPIGGGSLVFSNDNGNSWYPLPARYSIRNVTPPHSFLDPHKTDYEEIIELLESNLREPVGHELLREAIELKNQSPRSAVLVAVSALEVATKAVIIDKVSDAEWLVEKMQSPPVVDILFDYFPRLFPDVTKFYELKKDQGIIKTIADAVRIRNEIAHKGFAPPTHEKVAEIILAVKAILWVCDYYSGYRWAEQNIKSWSN